MADEFGRFTRAASSVRDNLLVAIADGRMRDVADGYDTYFRLLVHIAETERASITRAGRGAQEFGREWDHVIRDVYTVSEAAAQASAVRVWTDTVDWLRRLLMAFVDRHNYQAVERVFRVLVNAWSEALQAGRQEEAHALTILLRVREFFGYASRQIAADAHSPESLNPGSRKLSDVLGKATAEVVKAAVDYGSGYTARLAVLYCEPYVKTSDGTTERLAGVLAADAWSDLTRHRRNTQLELGSFHSAVSGAFDAETWWPTVRYCLRAGEDHLGWEWWELSGPEPVRSGFLELSNYVLESALRIASDIGRVVVPARPTSEDVGLARRVQEVLRQRDEYAYSRLSNDVDRIVAEADESREHQTSLMALDEERISRFRNGMAGELDAQRSRQLAQLFLFSEDEGKPSEQATLARPNARIYDRLEPRWYFVDSYVHADPEDLGREWARAVLWQEDQAVAEAVYSAGAEFGAPGNRFDGSRAVAEWLSEQPDASSFVVVTNSWAAFEELRGDPDGVAHYSSDSAAHASGAEIRRIDDDRSPFITIVPPGAVVVRRERLERDELLQDIDLTRRDAVVYHAFSNDPLTVVLFTLTAEEAQTLIVREGIDDRVRQAQIRGLVRLLIAERFDVVTSDVASAPRWTLFADDV